MEIKKFNENWFQEEEHDHSEIENVSTVLNDTGAYNKIGEVLGIEIDNDSMIFNEIEEFIVTKFKEMRDEGNEEY